ncbi:MAG TPA: four helix bundle protein [Terriglobales bacterium]|nr:four helix bundle protein [Terriglobales bacterium]
MAQTFRDLIAWQKSIELVSAIYRAAEAFPRTEIYGLTNQLRRAAVSIPSNIAEGQSRHSHPEFHHFLRNARGSLGELETQLIIARNLGFLAPKAADALFERSAELGRILNALLSAIEKQKRGGLD